MLALITGAGDLPAAVAAARPTPPLVATMHGFHPNGLTADPDLIWRVERLATLCERLRAKGVTEVCICGAVQRPEVDERLLDEINRPQFERMRDAMRDKGDDGALRAFMSIFEDAGLTVRAAHDVAPSLLPEPGVLSQCQPPSSAEPDAQKGDVVSVEQGMSDLGQSCVIREGRVVAREDRRGTDAMLADLSLSLEDGNVLGPARDGIEDLVGVASDWLTGKPADREGMFYKAPKPGQDRRADLPVVGPDTVDAVAQAGLAGLTIAAGGVMVLHLDQVIARCDAMGLYLWVRGQ